LNKLWYIPVKTYVIKYMCLNSYFAVNYFRGYLPNIPSRFYHREFYRVSLSLYPNINVKAQDEMCLFTRPGSDRMVVGFTTTYAISAYRHWSVWCVQHYVIKFVSDLRHVGGFLRVLRFPPPIQYCWKWR
jgi:hypothetical protein